MKYFTSEWYELMQQLDYTICLKPIADGDYSDADIKRLYDRALKAELKRARQEHDSPPFFVDPEFDSPDFDLDDYAIYNPETQSLRKPESKEELVNNYLEEKRRATEEFENRPPFDEEEAARNFEVVYESKLKYALTRFPQEYRDRIDPRLVALDFLPKTVYGELKALEKSNRAKFRAIEKAAARELSKQKIPPHIAEQFGYHDGEVFYIKRLGEDVVMGIATDCGAFYDGETPYTRVTFTDATVKECVGFDLDFKAGAGDDSYLVWLYEELYSTDGGYEAHIMFTGGSIIIACRDIVIENNLAKENL